MDPFSPRSICFPTKGSSNNPEPSSSFQQFKSFLLLAAAIPEHKYNKPMFDWTFYSGSFEISDEMQSFVKYDRIPEDDTQKCRLAWDICLGSFVIVPGLRSRTCDDYKEWMNQRDRELVSTINALIEDQELTIALKSIFKGVTELNFESPMRFKNGCGYIESCAFQVLCVFLANHFTGYSIHFDDINIGKSNSEQCGSSLFLLLNKCPALHKISFTNSSLVKNELVQIIDGIKENSAIKYVTFQYCGLGDTHAAEISEAFTNNSNLQEVNLRGNEIGKPGALALISHNMFISLDLSGNFIDDSDYRDLVQALAHNISLTHINLNENINREKKPGLVGKLIIKRTQRTPKLINGEFKPNPKMQAHIDRQLRNNKELAEFPEKLQAFWQAIPRGSLPLDILGPIFAIGNDTILHQKVIPPKNKSPEAHPTIVSASK